jgi:hypothetical protein
MICKNEIDLRVRYLRGQLGRCLGRHRAKLRYVYSRKCRADSRPPNLSKDEAFGLLLIAAVILASCSTSRTETPTAEAAPPPLTQSKAAEQCWMETEHGAKSLPAEKRAKVVDQCVKDKMSGAK